jgi:hypothetical protein
MNSLEWGVKAEVDQIARIGHAVGVEWVAPLQKCDIIVPDGIAAVAGLPIRFPRVRHSVSVYVLRDIEQAVAVEVVGVSVGVERHIMQPDINALLSGY